jgi:uncharacterized protein YqeY
MTLQQRIEKDRIVAMKDKNIAVKNELTVILGEFQRVNDGKPIDDNTAIGELIKMKKNEIELLKAKGESSSVFMDLMKIYLPEMATDDDIREFIKTLDLNKYPKFEMNMKDIMAHFGKLADGKRVSAILQEFKNGN